MKLPPCWSYAGYQDPFAMYTDGKLVVGFQMLAPRAGEVTLHVSVSRVAGTRPNQKDMSRVEKDFLNVNLARIEENNKIFECAESVRNLWQRMDVSVITGDLMTPEMKNKMDAVIGAQKL